MSSPFIKHEAIEAYIYCFYAPLRTWKPHLSLNLSSLSKNNVLYLVLFQDLDIVVFTFRLVTLLRKCISKRFVSHLR